MVLGLGLGWSLAGPVAVFGQNSTLPGASKSLQPSLSPAPVSDAKLKVFAQALALIEGGVHTVLLHHKALDCCLS